MDAALAHCVIWDNYRVTQPIVAELKILGEVRYPKEIARIALSQKLTKINA